MKSTHLISTLSAQGKGRGKVQWQTQNIWKTDTKHFSQLVRGCNEAEKLKNTKFQLPSWIRRRNRGGTAFFQSQKGKNPHTSYVNGSWFLNMLYHNNFDDFSFSFSASLSWNLGATEFLPDEVIPTPGYRTCRQFKLIYQMLNSKNCKNHRKSFFTKGLRGSAMALKSLNCQKTHPKITTGLGQ